MAKKVPRNEARQALLECTLTHLAAKGPANVQPKDVCAELGLSKALVNYHFGGRDALITEAMVLGYERYVETLWEAAESAGSDPLDRLMAWVDAQVEWTSANAGLAAALNFPFFASGLPVDLDGSAVERLTAAGARNFSNLQQLVSVAKDAVSKKKRRGRPDAVEVGLDSAIIGWMTLGLSVWKAGNHLPTQGLNSGTALTVARNHMRAEIRAMIER